MRAVVVGVDVGGDLLSRLVEGLALGAPDELLFQLPEPAQPERRRFGAAVAARRWATPCSARRARGEPQPQFTLFRGVGTK